MKSVLLVGLGRFGRYIAQTLNELGHEVLAIDTSEERVNDALKYVTNAQIGDASNERFIESLGVRNFDLCIVAISDNFQNSLEVTALLKDYGAPFVLSRATDESHAKFLLRNGADDVVFLEKQMASWAAIKYSNDSIFDYMELTEDYAIYETPVPEAWFGRTVLDLDVRKKFDINVLGTKKKEVFTPLSSIPHVFQADENLLVMGARKDMQKFLKLYNK